MDRPFDAGSNPFLQGVFAPVQRELDDTPLRLVAGAIPDDLVGTYLRNGPNARFPPIGSYTYPLDGDGMVHAVGFADRRATYRNRYVRTPSIAAEERAGRALWGGVMTPITPSAAQVGPELVGRFKDLPDINIVHHAGRLLALAEGARPFLLTDSLDTVGPWYFGGQLPKGITAHPKLDPVTGELVVFRYDVLSAPYLSWAVIGADGTVTRAEQPIDIDAAYMIHDFVITPHYIVLFVCPARFDFSGPQVLRWEPERGTRIAVIARDSSSATRWIATEAFWVWHFANAFEEIGDNGATTIVVDYAHWSHLALQGPQTATGGVTRARLDAAAATARFEAVDDQPTEFPRIDDRRVGQPHRYFHAASKDGNAQGRGMWNVIRRYDTHTGAVTSRSNGATMVGEAIFVPSSKGGEGDGYLLAYAFAGDATELLILHASDIAGEPAAVLRLPQRVPVGLHGCWVPGAR